MFDRMENKEFTRMQKLAGLINEIKVNRPQGYSEYDLGLEYANSPETYSYEEVFNIFDQYDNDDILEDFTNTFMEGTLIKQEKYFNFAKKHVDVIGSTDRIKADWVSLTDGDVYKKANLD